MNKKYFLAIFIFSLAFVSVFPQSALLPSGGNSDGIGGRFCYSVGQPFYNILGKNITVAEGVQQPYEISQYELDFDGKGIGEDSDDNLIVDLSVYPNPTADYLNLKVSADEFVDMECRLFDVDGKMLFVNGIYSSETLLDMQGLSAATYFIRVLEGGKEIKTFKVVKK